MTREEWYASLELRFLNNIAAGIQHKTQELYDVLELILAEKPDLIVFDRFTLVERQAKIVNLEASKLWDYCRKLATILEPKIEDVAG